MVDPNLLKQARQGDEIALQTLLNDSLRPHGIWSRVESDGATLSIALESTQPPEPEAMVKRLQAGLHKLQPSGIAMVHLSGWGLGDAAPTWERQVRLADAGTAAVPPAESMSSDMPLPSSAYTPISLSESSVNDSAMTPQDLGRSPRPSARPAVPATRSPQPPPFPRLPNRRKSKQPFVLKWSDFDPMMLAIVGFVAIYGFLGARNPSYDGPFIWLHYPNLAIHETGHLLFMPFGHFLMVLGGSLTQIAFPAVFTGYFFYSRQYFSSVLTLFWTGQNFMDVAVYMADAPYRALPLTNPNIDAHDWWQLFNLMNCMNQADLIAGLTHWVGVLIYILSIIAGVYVAYWHKQTMDAEQRRREERLHSSS